MLRRLLLTMGGALFVVACGGGSSSGTDAGTETATLAATIDSSGTINGIAASDSKATFYVAVATGATTGDVQVIDATNTVVATIDVGGPPQGIAVDDNTGQAFVTVGDCTGASGKLVVIDLGTNAVTTSAPTTAGFQPGIALAMGNVYATPCSATAITEYSGTTGAATSRTFPFTGQQVSVGADSLAPALFWLGSASGQTAVTKYGLLFGAGSPTTTMYAGTPVSIDGVVDQTAQAVVATSSPDVAQLVDPTMLSTPAGAQVYSVRYVVLGKAPDSFPAVQAAYCLAAKLVGCDYYDLSGTLLKRVATTKACTKQPRYTQPSGERWAVTVPGTPTDQTLVFIVP